jgi:hypothetical protein
VAAVKQLGKLLKIQFGEVRCGQASKPSLPPSLPLSLPPFISSFLFLSRSFGWREKPPRRWELK